MNSSFYFSFAIHTVLKSPRPARWFTGFRKRGHGHRACPGAARTASRALLDRIRACHHSRALRHAARHVAFFRRPPGKGGAYHDAGVFHFEPCLRRIVRPCGGLLRGWRGAVAYGRGQWWQPQRLRLRLPQYLTGSRWIYLGSHVFCLVLFVAVACLLLADKKQAQTPSPSPTRDLPPPLPAPRSPLPALLLGFTPAILVLLTITLASSGATNHMSNDESRGLLWLASIVSVACCIVSSVMLFKRKTGAAIAGAVLLLLLNGFLSFFFGCCASLVGASFH